MITFQQQETTEIRNRIRAAWATFHKYRQELGITHDELRLKNLDTHKRTRKNDSIDARQNASPRHTNAKKIQKDREKKDET